MFTTVLGLVESNAVIVGVCAITACIFSFVYSRRKRTFELTKKVSANLHSHPTFAGTVLLTFNFIFRLYVVKCPTRNFTGVRTRYFLPSRG